MAFKRAVQEILKSLLHKVNLYSYFNFVDSNYCLEFIRSKLGTHLKANVERQMPVIGMEQHIGQ